MNDFETYAYEACRSITPKKYDTNFGFSQISPSTSLAFSRFLLLGCYDEFPVAVFINFSSPSVYSISSVFVNVLLRSGIRTRANILSK